MRDRFRVAAIGLVMMAVLATTACGDSNGEGPSTKTATHPPTSIAVATEGESDRRDAAPTSPLFIATAPGQDPFDKTVPTGPAPTEPSLPPSDFDADGDGFYTNDELAQAIRFLFPSYEWPNDYRVTADMIIDSMDMERFPHARNQALGEYTVIGNFHKCAWEMTWLDAYRDGDESTLAKSLDQLRSVSLKNPLSHSSYIDHRSETFDRAELGDPTLIGQDVESSCDLESQLFITPSPISSPAANAASDTIARLEKKVAR